ncbi:hypothetical protein [Winogradskyella sp. PG-2]|uniref:hypothetical protein n=1 Tax=Winogradskyella sp. PG-2 TaxID=754409 RepID=UPI0004586437|nr:hypothetical protein [Winogradskyella sp. PG-2]BAO75353.1 hypothetical protein WPG_1123 [Winogradskyella sp. PG-2]
MTKINKYWFLIILIPLLGVSQGSQLLGFENLVNKTWFAEGEWSNGTKFKQEVTFAFDLNKSIIKADSKGYTNQEQTEYGNRNHGIRQYNSNKGKIEFWEFDIFGGVTQGIVTIENNNIWYSYKYGESTVTDCWEYIDDETYRFTVGSYKEGKWQAIYLQTEFKLKNE